MSTSAEGGICKIFSRSGKWTSLVGMGVPLGEGTECPIRDLGNRTSSRAFKQGHVSRSVLAKLIVRLNAGSLEKEDGVKLWTVSLCSCPSTKLQIIMVFISYSLSNIMNQINEMARML